MDAGRKRLAFVYVLYVLLVATASASAEQRLGQLNVSARVLSPHRPELVATLPAMPLSAHVLQEDARGVHYFFNGSLSSAREHYRQAMEKAGYRLRSQRAKGEFGQEMLWEKSGETALVQLRAATGFAPTRISVRLMAGPHPQIRK